MPDSPKVILRLVCAALSALLISSRFACAQSTGADSTWAVLDVIGVINGEIEESKEGVELREKVVRRFSECSLMYGGLSTLTSNAEAKKNYVQAQVATMEIESTIAKPMQSEKRLEIEETARKSVAIRPWECRPPRLGHRSSLRRCCPRRALRHSHRRHCT